MSDFFQIPAWAQARLEAETTPRPLTSAQAEYLAMTKGPQMLVLDQSTHVVTMTPVEPDAPAKRPGRPKGSKNKG